MPGIPSTSPWQPMPHTARLQDMPKPVLDVAARELGVEARGSAAKVRAIEAVHADRDQVTSRVSRLPPLCWLVLEILADAGGSLPERELVAMARHRIGSAPRELTGCVEALVRPLFVARISARNAFGQPVSRLVLLGSVAETLATLVRGLTLPVDPPQAAAGATTATNEREILALATLTAHRRVRVNRDGSPNRASLKSLVKTLVIDLERAEERLAQASIHGLLVERLDAFAPVLPALRTAAERGLRGSEAEAALLAWLPASGWVPVEQFLRARWRSELDERARVGGFAWLGTTYDQRQELGVIRARGIDVAESRGHTWVRRRSETLELRGDGHVTPNLEVFLGPGAHPTLVVTIGLGAELVRVDNVLTFRLSPASVRTGLGVGLTAQELIEALERVGPHGLADNVRHSVLDFARQARIAELRTATVLRLPADSAAAFCAKYEGMDIERVTPEVVLVRSDWDQKELERCLEGLGVYVRDVDASRDAQVGSARPLQAVSTDDLEPAAALRPTPELARRFAEDRKTGFAASRQAAAELRADTQPRAADVEALIAQIRSKVSGASVAVQRLLVACERLASQADGEIEAWCARLGPGQRIEAKIARGVPLLLAPFLALTPEWRAQAMHGARSVGDLLHAAVRLGKPNRYSVEGLTLVREVNDAEVVSLTTRTIEQALKDAGPLQLASGNDKSAELEGLDDDFEDELDEDFEDEEDEDDEDDEADDYGPECSIELPPRDSFPPLDAQRIARALERAIADGDAVYVKLKTPSGARVQALLPEGVRKRADQQILLATDLETEVTRVIPMSDIESVLAV
jgi:hypothetical protein